MFLNLVRIFFVVCEGGWFVEGSGDGFVFRLSVGKAFQMDLV